MRVRLESIGCRLNLGEAERMGRTFAGRGHRIVGPGDDADLVVFNSCAVTHVASRKSRKLLRQIRRRHPDATLVATGCYSELSAREVVALGVDRVVSNRDKDRLPDILERDGLIHDADPVPDAMAAIVPESSHSLTRAFVKVQDGCDNRCTFCIVTIARGDSRSRPAEAVVSEIRELVQLGYREVVLSGVHLGSWGQDLQPVRGLGDLLDRILSETDLARLRLSSLEPWDLSPDFFDLWSDLRLLPHLHLPLQSGCDLTLERMARRTTQREFRSLVEAARERIPDVSITSDVIAGFPGEDDAEFEDSFAFIRDLDLSGLHVFRYSARDGTAAARMPGRVAEAAIKERSRRMHALAARQEERFRRRFLGRRLEVLWESSEAWGDGLRWSGLTGNYLRVVTATGPDTDLANRLRTTELIEPASGALVGLVPESTPPEPSDLSTSLTAGSEPALEAPGGTP